MKNIIPERFFAALAVKRYIERNLMKKKKQIEEQTEEQTVIVYPENAQEYLDKLY